MTWDKRYAGAAHRHAEFSEALRWAGVYNSGDCHRANEVVRDGDWLMVANTNTCERPAPQPIGPEHDLLPAWTPVENQQTATVETAVRWTVSTAGWITQIGADLLARNLDMAHAAVLLVDGVTVLTRSFMATTTGLRTMRISPVVVPAGAVVELRLTVTQPAVGNAQVGWVEQPGLFATLPLDTMVAEGQFGAGTWSDTRYGLHVGFQPGAMPDDWDVLAFMAGSSAGGGEHDHDGDYAPIGHTHPDWSPVGTWGGSPVQATLNSTTWQAINSYTLNLPSTHAEYMLNLWADALIYCTATDSANRFSIEIRVDGIARSTRSLNGANGTHVSHNVHGMYLAAGGSSLLIEVVANRYSGTASATSNVNAIYNGLGVMAHPYVS